MRFDDDLLPYTWLNRVSDVLGLVRALGFERVAAVVGHDWGGPTAAWCGLVRPDVFESVVLIEHTVQWSKHTSAQHREHPPEDRRRC